MNSTPNLFEFKPHMAWQKRLVKDVLYNYDYSLGTHVALCSGSVGSGKSLPAAHLGVWHCIKYDGARLLLGRKALPDLKDTIFKKICEHLECTQLEPGRDYRVVENTARIVFRNGSEIISRSWADRKFKKLGSLELSAAIIEEGAENDEEDKKAFEFIKMRVGRLPHIKENWIIMPTNPDEPDHWIYKDIISKPNDTTHIYYSKLSENPFLPESYESNLRANMDPLMARRMLDGEWISILGQGVYHAYTERNRIHQNYVVNPNYPVQISWDWNIGENKPMSLCMMQYIDGIFHVFAEVVIEGMRTLESCDELADRGLLNPAWTFELDGDATGRARDTRNNLSDWEIVEKFFANYRQDGMRLSFSVETPRSNPPVRERHNTVNAFCCNAHGEIRLFVYDGCDTVDQGMRMTKLKKNGNYIEDDSKPYQHITTALGYAIHRKVNETVRQAPRFL